MFPRLEWRNFESCFDFKRAMTRHTAQSVNARLKSTWVPAESQPVPAVSLQVSPPHTLDDAGRKNQEVTLQYPAAIVRYDRGFGQRAL